MAGCIFKKVAETSGLKDNADVFSNVFSDVLTYFLTTLM